MASRFNLKSALLKTHSAPMAAKSKVFLGLSLASLMVVLLLKWIPALAMTLPIFGISAVGYWLQAEFQQEQNQRQKRKAMVDAKFYRLLRQQQGRISVLDFAMHAQLTGPAAQAYLNRQAQTFSAYIDAGTAASAPGTTTTGMGGSGNLIYVFELTGLLMDLSGSDVNTTEGDRGPRQAEAVWAIAEQTRRQQARMNQAQAAWANAKQIRHLQKISQRESATGLINTNSINIRQINNDHDQGLARLTSSSSSSQPLSSKETSNSEPTPIQAGYIAISTIDSQGKEQGSYPSKVSPAQNGPANTPKRPAGHPQKRRSSDEAFTIDVPAIRG